MKKVQALLEVVLILVLSIASLAFYSIIDYQISFEVNLKKSEFREVLLAPEEEPFLAEAYQDFYEEVSDSIMQEIAAQAPKVDSASQVILLTGDSMCEGLMFRFKEYAAYNNHQLKTVIWYSSTTQWWSESDSLKKLVKKYEPDYVFFTTGSNELFIRNIEEREKYIQDIVKQVGNRKFIWIGPPNWAEDTGINDLIEKNVGRDRFFESRHLEFDRASDGAHPTWSSAAVWADTISSWVMEKSRNKILLKEPPKN